ncbi:IclR family transcriptional regulator [Bordetella bronchiseptica]|uniref:IclR family transcriptional regulator n=1 Tax=Bordetella bronchiseptica TaxID=518 RepID=UPI00067B74E1|nr:IclR family transcriptional regulator [Bordetella bronchiseptica]RSB99749.1 IclR family transcriptional regulator [Bordetella bronchiseptica]RSC08811.1 IclR family transcriptional regulator [Bordetella bronchiseptica]
MKHLEYLLNALDVLEAVGKSESDIALSAVARNVGVSKSGVFRILSTFESRGYAEKGPGGGWRLGPRIIELGVGVPQRTLLTTAAPLMEALTKETLESTYLSVRDGFSMITLHTLEPDQTIRVHLPVGARTPANCTVSGLAVLANMDEQELLAMLPDELEGTAPASIVDRARLMEELRTIRERGYAAFLGAWRPDTGGGAAPIFDATGRVVASLGISAPSSRLSEGRLHELGQRAQEAALQISRQLGYVGRLSAVEAAGPASLAQAAAPSRRNS